MNITLNSITLDLGGKRILDDVSFTVEDGQFVSLLGASGAGKSTILKVLAGLIYQDTGTVSFDGHVVDELPTFQRRVAIVFQDIRLFPNMSVLDNVAFSLKMQKVAKAERHERASEMLERVKLGGFGNRRVNELSGGQQQRVALARALAGKPAALLLDEPFSGLDENLRDDMRELVSALHRESGMTSIMVTHDANEALVMSDQIVYLADGKVIQHADPRTLVLEPASAEIVKSFGESSVLEGSVERGLFTKGKLELPAAGVPDGRAAYVRLSDGTSFVEPLKAVSSFTGVGAGTAR